MPLSRKLYTSKSAIKKINAAYDIVNKRNSNNLLNSRKPEDVKRQILNSFDKKISNNISRNDDEEKRRLIQNFDKKKVDELLKSKDEKSEILNSFDNSNKNNISRNDDEEKRRLIQNFDSKKINELLKRQKFAPESNEEPIIIQPDEPEFTYCELYESDQIFDTGFEDGCNYFGYLTILGPFTILENFETRTDDDIGGEMFNVSPFKYIDDFETSDDDNIDGELFLTDLYEYVEDFETSDDDNIDGQLIDFS